MIPLYVFEKMLYLYQIPKEEYSSIINRKTNSSNKPMQVYLIIQLVQVKNEDDYQVNQQVIQSYQKFHIEFLVAMNKLIEL
jgi:hypothetical protein